MRIGKVNAPTARAFDPSCTSTNIYPATCSARFDERAKMIGGRAAQCASSIACFLSIAGREFLTHQAREGQNDADQ